MPELPEVETVVRTLRGLVMGKTIERVSVHLARIVRQPDDVEAFKSLLVGQTIQDIQRRAKFIQFFLNEDVLVSHLRMEGRYGVYQADDPVEKHTHVVFHFTDGTELRYRDVRQFGTMDLFPKGKETTVGPLAKLGVEPLDKSFTPEVLGKLLKGRSTKIKPLLLNQECIVGLGNIYVDESLFKAGIHPEKPAGKLTDKEVNRLHESIVSTLQEAVEQGGSSIKSYVNGQGEMGMFQQSLLVYGRKDEACTKCGTEIIRFVVGGRGTHICPDCQKL
ncbi:DNA-formamidopyrimidine glycosylase [Brevibacillus formosus]|uniref:Formamidopyrimidine-DNA glycosylase n=1 Tax=Brevibacillus formosus TaxID=54913 RepID=A0A837KMR6_9BACL|nr:MULTISPECIES: DNA-formamidopyrimidine glycosylase [Brevibacillus]KLH98342.1 5-hydroxymethyluracil DNA glycosylase [Brevibacillus formosus]MBG9943643.1 5-hydroxymethyluracil DNA glycosylase [Brevibacillus formosus]MBW5467952.1 DNA-formamidopyrimidine glycosylase [Brevibacillus formosus]MED1948202.1 DNA-formamidopyrimidine glycosylase [Brevibacillus formosus]MED1960703.1 DNA-formamidopyrimidine glycosylase [Brevibacillus formosus]